MNLVKTPIIHMHGLTTYIRISRVENGPGWLNELGSWIT